MSLVFVVTFFSALLCIVLVRNVFAVLALASAVSILSLTAIFFALGATSVGDIVQIESPLAIALLVAEFLCALMFPILARYLFLNSSNDKNSDKGPGSNGTTLRKNHEQS